MAENKWVTEVFLPHISGCYNPTYTWWHRPSCGKLPCFRINFPSSRAVQTFSLDRLVEMAYDDWSSGRPPLWKIGPKSGWKKVEETSETKAENYSMVKFKHGKVDRKLCADVEIGISSCFLLVRWIFVHRLNGSTDTLHEWTSINLRIDMYSQCLVSLRLLFPCCPLQVRLGKLASFGTYDHLCEVNDQYTCI